MPLAKRLAMLQVGGSHETPLTRASGKEKAVEVKGKGDEDVLEMVILLRGGDHLLIVLDEGSMDLSPDPSWAAYFFRKRAGSKTPPTTIEMVLCA